MASCVAFTSRPCDASTPNSETQAAADEMSYRDYLALLVAEEVAHRTQTRIQRCRDARHTSPSSRTIEDFDFTFQTSVRLSLLGCVPRPRTRHRRTQPHLRGQARHRQNPPGGRHRLPRHPERLRGPLHHRRRPHRPPRPPPAATAGSREALGPYTPSPRPRHRRGRLPRPPRRRRQRPLPRRQRTPPPPPAHALHHQQAPRRLGPRPPRPRPRRRHHRPHPRTRPPDRVAGVSFRTRHLRPERRARQGDAGPPSRAEPPPGPPLPLRGVPQFPGRTVPNFRNLHRAVREAALPVLGRAAVGRASAMHTLRTRRPARNRHPARRIVTPWNLALAGWVAGLGDGRGCHGGDRRCHGATRRRGSTPDVTKAPASTSECHKRTAFALLLLEAVPSHAGATPSPLTTWTGERTPPGRERDR